MHEKMTQNEIINFLDQNSIRNATIEQIEQIRQENIKKQSQILT